MDEIGSVITKNPQIKRIQIEGYASSEGDAAHNKKLSDDRAKSVMKYLTDHGIAAQRLTAIGFGIDKPIADNTTEDGREKNRRVEFSILEQDVTEKKVEIEYEDRHGEGRRREARGRQSAEAEQRPAPEEDAMTRMLATRNASLGSRIRDAPAAGGTARGLEAYRTRYPEVARHPQRAAQSATTTRSRPTRRSPARSPSSSWSRRSRARSRNRSRRYRPLDRTGAARRLRGQGDRWANARSGGSQRGPRDVRVRIQSRPRQVRRTHTS